jgi:1-phosphatidylinositol-4-phosphate 5-kinase
MDYSLLIGIIPGHTTVTSNGYISTILDNGSQEVYYFGIIDILQKWNNKKKLAGAMKSIRFNRMQLSTIKPSDYVTRFCKFMESIII